MYVLFKQASSYVLYGVVGFSVTDKVLGEAHRQNDYNVLNLLLDKCKCYVHVALSSSYALITIRCVFKFFAWGAQFSLFQCVEVPWT